MNICNYVASNEISLVQVFYEEELYPLGIYNDDEMLELDGIKNKLPHKVLENFVGQSIFI